MEELKVNLILGDCLEKMLDIPSNSVDLIFCDLPYGITNCKWDSLIDLNKLWVQYERIIKDKGCILLFAQTPFDKLLGSSNLKLLKYEWIWEKTQATGHLNAKKMPMKAHENILVFYKNTPKYFPIKTVGHKLKISLKKHKENTLSNQSDIYNKSDNFSDYSSTERYPRSVLKFSSDKQKVALHSTQKPLDLCKYLIQTYTEKYDTVLDNAMGSGTIPLACALLNRNVTGIEKDLEIFNIAKNRIYEQLNLNNNKTNFKK